MAKLKYEVVYKRINKANGHVISSACKAIVDAESETNAIAAAKKHMPVGELHEIVSVTPKK